MHYTVEISEGIYWLGVNDRRTELFEGLWPLPRGVSYNSYLIVDEKTVLLDTLAHGADPSFVARIESLLAGRDLDYLVIDHMELDHAGEIAAVVCRWPGVTIVGNGLTFNVLDAYYGGLKARRKEVGDGETLTVGKRTLTFALTPMVHWPECMVTYDGLSQTLFSGDAFGTFGAIEGTVIDGELDRQEMRRYYSNIVGRFGPFVQKALKKLADLPLKTVCPLHGPVWREKIPQVVQLYDKWSRGESDPAVAVIYGSMYGNTARMADYIAGQIAAQGVGDIRIYDVSKTHLSFLISEIWRCRTVVLGSCTYNTDIFPPVEALTRAMEHYALGGRKLALFGSYSWHGGGMRKMRGFADRIGWEVLCEPVDMLGRPDADKYAACDAIAKAVAQSVLL